MPHWAKDQHAIVFAARLIGREARRDIGIDANQIAFAPTQCSGNFVAHIEDDLGPGYPPTNPPK
jgi:hypothetical protein